MALVVLLVSAYRLIVAVDTAEDLPRGLRPLVLRHFPNDERSNASAAQGGGAGATCCAGRRFPARAGQDSPDRSAPSQVSASANASSVVVGVTVIGWASARGYRPGTVIRVTPSGRLRPGTSVRLIAARRPDHGKFHDHGHGHGDGQGGNGQD